MRWSIVGLILVGVLAALSASLLVASLTTRGRAQNGGEPAQTTVLLAARKLEAMSVIEPHLIRKEAVPAASLPKGSFTEPFQVIGRMLAVPVTEGQALTETVFAPQGPGFVMATNLPQGQRAVTVSLPISASMRGLLYPGSVVDVVVSFRLQSHGQQTSLGEAVSTTILESLQVLAVEDQTVGGATNEEMATGAKMAASRATMPNRCLVTLKVDPQQAEALQLASEYGAVSLALRNPTDASRSKQDPTLLSQGRLAQMASMLQAMAATSATQQREQPERARPRTARTNPNWQIEVIRGGKREMQSVALD